MVAIPPRRDPVLDAIDRILEEKSLTEPRRKYLGMSSIGDSCSRKLWYRFHTDHQEKFDALTLRRFEDGHRTEELVVSWFKMLPGIEIHPFDNSGNQFSVSDFNGKFSGHLDGAIRGLYQAPKTWHVFEVKCTNEKNFEKLKGLVFRNEKTALREWSKTYFAQAIMYMHYTGMDRHYLVCTTPGGRELTSVRTEADPAFAEALRMKAERIINATTPPERIGDQTWWECKFCSFYKMCQNLPDD